jgi:MFS family permease
MNKDYFLLWQGQFVSRLGSQVFSIAMILWIKTTTDSASLMGLMAMLAAIPGLIVGPIGGTFADRHSRRRIIIFSDLLNGLVVLSLAALLYFLPTQTEILLAYVLGVAVFIGLIGSFFTPAVYASIPDLVPKESIAGANSLGKLSGQVSLFVGQAIGGVLFRLLGAPLIVLINGVTYLFSAFSELFISIPQHVTSKGGSWRDELAAVHKDTVQGFRYVWAAPGLKQLVFVSAFLNLFATPIILLLPFFVEDVLQVGLDWYGYLLASFGVGSLIGSLLAGFVRLPAKARGAIMIVFMVLESLASAVLGLAQGPLLAMLLTFTAGLMGGFIGVNIVTILQKRTPSEIRGRVFGFLSTLAGSVAPIGMGLGGVAADLLGHNIPLIYMVCGGIMAVLSVLTSLSSQFRGLVSYEGEVEVAEVLKKPVALSTTEAV